MQAEQHTQFDTGTLPAMIGSSAVMQRLRRQLQRVAATQETVLVMGENGTGKEIVAKTLHAMSERSSGAWVTLNCPALNAQLLESELFGHKKGAFTGADHDRIGRFEMADHGTLLLDEISEIDLFLQSKLLRVLQERSFERVGSSETTTVDVRVIATTNRNLLSEIETGRFREDLYYRLAVLPIEVPSLRDRRDDIPELIAYFAAKAAERLNQEPSQFDDGAVNALCDYHWPGNVRQLENMVTRVSIFCDDQTVHADDVRHWLFEHSGMTSTKNIAAAHRLQATHTPIPTQASTRISPQHFESLNEIEQHDKHHKPQHDSQEHTLKPLSNCLSNSLSNRLISGTYSPEHQAVTLKEETGSSPMVGMTLENLEQQLIQLTLEHFNGHRAKTAEMLGIGLRTLTSKIAKMKEMQSTNGKG